MDWLDQYEIRARIVPAAIISLPIAISIIAIISTTSDQFTQWILGGGFIYIIFSYMLSFLIRYNGRELEKDLWTKWDGAPSTRFMRWRDSTFGNDLKQQLHEVVKNDCGITLSTRSQEEIDPGKADEQISQSFLHVKGIVRKDDPEGVWSKHNAEYGFHRNLLGSRKFWLAFSIVGIMACVTSFYFMKNENLVIGLALNILLAIISILGGWYYLPMMIRTTADRYAESTWISFLACLEKRSH